MQTEMLKFEPRDQVLADHTDRNELQTKIPMGVSRTKVARAIFLRQRNTILPFTPYSRANAATDAPRTNVSSTIRRLTRPVSQRRPFSREAS